MNLLAAVIGMLCVVGCNGSGGSNVGGGGGGGNTPTGANVQPVVVDSGPTQVANSTSPAVNTLYTSVTVCVPGTSTCQTIDHIQVDTGSAGLRIVGSVLTLNLPSQTDLTGKVIAECTQFVDGSSWGVVHLADVKISGEVAGNQAVQVIGASTYAVPTSSCTGSAENTVTDFGANGILGIGPFVQDCGPNCTVDSQKVYYTCVNTNDPQCVTTPVKQSLQVSNPVAFFSTDNNGIIIQLNPVNGTAASVSGSLIFGIGTQGNNGVGNAKVLGLDDTGRLTTTYNNDSLTQSFIDSGSNAYYFPDKTSSIPICGANGAKTSAKGFFCPASTLNLSAILGGLNGINSTINFSVANADSLFSGTGTIAAAATLAAPSTTVGASDPQYDGNLTFDWGLPFYYGRTVFTAIEGQNTSAGAGPYFAF